MRRLISFITFCVLALPTLGQSTSKYQVAIITDVKPHQVASDTASDPVNYDVTVRVGDTTYVVLYTPPLGELPPKYARGHQILVLVEKNTITYNDMLGRSVQVPIQSEKPAPDSKRSK